MTLMEKGPGLYLGTASLRPGEVGNLLSRFAPSLVIGHPTYRNHDNIGDELRRDIEAVSTNYPERQVAIIVSDGTWQEKHPDTSTLEAAIQGASRALALLGPDRRSRLAIVAVPYDGYQGNNTPGKGSALKLIFEEMAYIPAARTLVLLDGDLRNDFVPWFRVFRRLEQEHFETRPGRDFFVTARYARHFVDASLTRFVVGPLTTLMGQYVPGGISGDIVLSAGAVANERRAHWDENRRRYGTDISTTFDNIADPAVDVYEVYLGAKLHDITDEAKLSVMPGEVIGAALSRLLHYERSQGRITALLQQEKDLERPIAWGPERTGIDFIDPGYTDVFDVDTKRQALIDRFEAHATAMATVLDGKSWERIQAAYQRLCRQPATADTPVAFLDVDRDFWRQILYQAVAFVLWSGDVEVSKQCLNYLYTAAFVEFCREKIAELGGDTYGQVRQMQAHLGVPPARAEEFYRHRVDAVVEQLALDFYRGRKAILHHRARLKEGI